MDYKYIEQLLEHYWKGETSLEEEEILRTFFSQKDIPSDLLCYRPLFAYEAAEVKEDVLGDDFDSKILAMTEDTVAVKARVVPFRQRLMPLFKAAAVVAIFLTLGNAAQVAFEDGNAAAPTTGFNTHHGASVALNDSTGSDSLQQGSIEPIGPQASIIK